MKIISESLKIKGLMKYKEGRCAYPKLQDGSPQLILLIHVSLRNNIANFLKMTKHYSSVLCIVVISSIVLFKATCGFDPFMDNELHKIEWVDTKNQLDEKVLIVFLYNT